MIRPGPTRWSSNTAVELASRVASRLFIPFTVGGGIRSVEDFRAILREGADKVSVNSAAIERPELISEAADKFGSQCVTVAIDAKKKGDGRWTVYKNGGRIDVGLDVVEWAMKAEKLGVKIPVIASGGAGKKEDFAEVFEKAHADAALAASLFHFNELPIAELKQYLRTSGIPVRL